MQKNKKIVVVGNHPKFRVNMVLGHLIIILRGGYLTTPSIYQN